MGDAHVVGSAHEGGGDVEQVAAGGDEGFIEVDEVVPLTLVYGAEVILEILKEGRVEVGGLKGIPMLALPVAVGADDDVLHRTFAHDEVGLVYGYGQMEGTVGRVDGAAVAQCLLDVVLVLLNQNRFTAHEGSEP